MTANRKYIHAQVSLREHRPRYSVTQWPWANVCHLKEAQKTTAGVRVQYDSQGPLGQYIDDLGCVVCSPRADLTTPTHQWYVNPTADVDLETEASTIFGKDAAQDFAAYWVRQRKQTTGSGAYVVSEWTSAFTVAPNPFLLIGLRRQACPKDYSGATVPATALVLGQTDDFGIAIYFPYRGKSYIKVYQNGWYGLGWYPYKWTSGSLGFGRGEDKEQQAVFAVGVVGGQLCVWEEDDANPKARFQMKRGEQALWLRVPSAPVRVTHNLGECAVMLRPLVLQPFQMTGPMVYVGYDDYTADATVGWQAYGYGVTDDEGGGYKATRNSALTTATFTPTYGSIEFAADVLPGDVMVGVPNANAYAPRQYACWMAELQPYTHASTFHYEGTDQTVETYSTPALYGVDMWQAAELADDGEPAESEDLTAAGKVHGIECDSPDGWAAEQCSLYLHNDPALGDYSANLGLLRQFNVTGVAWQSAYVYPDEGWTAEAGVDLGKYWIVEPHLDKEKYSAIGVDLMGLLGLYKVRDELPPGDRRALNEYIRDCLYAAQIGAGMQSLEDTGIIIQGGDYTAGKRAQYPKRGAGLAEFLQELQEKVGYGGAIWCELGTVMTGCKYCGTQRTAADYRSHNSAGWNSPGCAAADIARAGATGIDFYLLGSDAWRSSIPEGGLIVEGTSANRVDQSLLGRFANLVDITGEDATGQTVRTVQWDYDSFTDPAADNYAGGFLIPFVESDASTNTQALVNARGTQALNEKSERPIWIEAEFLTEPSVWRGKVFKVFGWVRQGLHEKKFRVVQVSPPIIRNGTPLSKVRARCIG